MRILIFISTLFIASSSWCQSSYYYSGAKQYTISCSIDCAYNSKWQRIVRSSTLPKNGKGFIDSIGFNIIKPPNDRVFDFITISVEPISKGHQFTLIPPLNFGARGFFEKPKYEITYSQVKVEYDTNMFAIPVQEWDGTSDLLVTFCISDNSADFFEYSVSKFADTSTLAFGDSFNRNYPVCDKDVSTTSRTIGPDFILHYWPYSTKPKAGGGPSHSYSCDGQVVCNDQSMFSQDSVVWLMGDGTKLKGSNIKHTYSLPGIYAITQLVYNAFGSDTLMHQFEYDLNIPKSMHNFCSVTTGASLANTGIKRVKYSGVDVTSFDALTEKNTELPCAIGYGVQARDLIIEMELFNGIEHQVKLWVDWNNDGQFDVNQELAYWGLPDSIFTLKARIPKHATLDSVLTLRIGSDGVSSGLAACGHSFYGQYEDYGLIVLANKKAPECEILIENEITCSKRVDFFDNSINVVDSFLWFFGDGDSSTIQHPIHDYKTDGTYFVQLIASNSFGSDTATTLIKVNSESHVKSAFCTPQTVDPKENYGIRELKIKKNPVPNTGNYYFIDLPNVRNTGSYMDLTCDTTGEFTVNEEIEVSFNSRVRSSLQHTQFYLDINDDGEFDFDELLGSQYFENFGLYRVKIPAVKVYDKPIRARIIADIAQGSLSSCKSPQHGQVIDFGIRVQPVGVLLPDTVPPIADFEGVPYSVCASSSLTTVNMYSTASSNTDQLEWTYGSGNKSSNWIENYQYSYGNYQISLEAKNSIGSHSISKDLHIIDANSCQDYSLDGSQLDSMLNFDCVSKFSSNERAGNLYRTIKVDEGKKLVLTMHHFDGFPGAAREPFGSLFIYDGESSNSPLLDSISYLEYPKNYLASSNTITLFLKRHVHGQFLDFDGTVYCDSENGIGSNEVKNPNSSISIYPNPVHDKVVVVSTRIADYQIVDLLGVEKLNGVLNMDKNEINVETLNSGIYLLIVDGVQVHRIVKH